MRLSMMVTVVLATIVIAGCASQPASVVSSAGIESLASPAEKTSWWRLLLTSNPPNYYHRRNDGSIPRTWESGVPTDHGSAESRLSEPELWGQPVRRRSASFSWPYPSPRPQLTHSSKSVPAGPAPVHAGFSRVLRDGYCHAGSRRRPVFADVTAGP